MSNRLNRLNQGLVSPRKPNEDSLILVEVFSRRQARMCFGGMPMTMGLAVRWLHPGRLTWTLKTTGW